MTHSPPTRLTFLDATGRIFALTLGEMLRSRRTLFLAILVLAPVLLALVFRLTSGSSTLRVDGSSVGAASIFGMLVWILYLRFIVPVLGVLYGTSLIADEVDDKTITYLFTRPVPRGAVLAGKYLAYLVCASLMVLPSVVLTYFLVVPLGGVAASFTWLVADLAILAFGLAVYGAAFALVGALVPRPLLAGLVFTFGWEQAALAMPGSLRRLTIAHYLQALVPHASPAEGGVTSLFQAVFRDAPSLAVSLLSLAAVLLVSLVAAVRVVERREYVLEQ